MIHSCKVPPLPLAFRFTDVSTKQEKYWYICFVEEDWYISYLFNETAGQVEELMTDTGRNATDFYILHSRSSVKVHIDVDLFWRNLI